MKSATVIPAPGSGAEALIKEARRRQRRRYAAVGVAVVLAAGVALGAFIGLRGVSEQRPGKPPARRLAVRPAPVPHVTNPIRSVGATVLMWPTGPGQDGTIGSDNLRTGRLGELSPVVDPGENQPIMLVSGWIVYVSNNGVRATNAVTDKTVMLGDAAAFAPAAAPGDVWLEYGYYRSSAAAVTVRAVSVSGGRPGPPITLPSGTQLIAGTDAGLMLEPRFSEVAGPFWLWTPGTAPRALPASRSAEGFAVSRRLAAFGTDCANASTAQSLSYGANFGYHACQTLRVLDLITGRVKSFAAPPGTAGWVPTHGGNWAWSASDIAPSGKLMAAAAVLPPERRGMVRVFILHATGPDTRATAVPSSAAFLLSVTAWSPDGSWLFYQGPGEHMWAYQVTTRQAWSSPARCCQYAVMATINSPPG